MRNWRGRSHTYVILYYSSARKLDNGKKDVSMKVEGEPENFTKYCQKGVHI